MIGVTNVYCPHNVEGCQWVGAPVQLQAHIAQCPFEAMRLYITEQAMEIQELRTQLQQMQVALSALMPQSTIPHMGLCAHSAAVVSLALSGSALYSGSMDGTLKETMLDTKKTIREVTLGPVFQLKIADGVLFSGHTNVIRVFDSNLVQLRELGGHSGNVKAMLIFGTYLFAGSEREIKIWNTSTFQCLGSCPNAHDVCVPFDSLLFPLPPHPLHVGVCLTVMNVLKTTG